jgi:hypothetical protein
MTISYPLPTDPNIATALQQLSNSTIVPSFFRSAELDLTTTNPHAMYDYQFSGAHVSNIDELLGYGQTHYSNNLLQDCSVQIISMTEYLSPNPVYALNSPATVGCNDAANNFYSVTMYQSDLDNNNLSALLFPGGAANVTQTYTMWATAARQVWLNVFAPNDRVHSVLRPSLLAKNLDSLTIVYFGANLK